MKEVRRLVSRRRPESGDQNGYEQQDAERHGDVFVLKQHLTGGR